MTTLGWDAYRQHGRDGSLRFRAVLQDQPSATRVPSCPDWVAPQSSSGWIASACSVLPSAIFPSSSARMPTSSVT